MLGSADDFLDSALGLRVENIGSDFGGRFDLASRLSTDHILDREILFVRDILY